MLWNYYVFCLDKITLVWVLGIYLHMYNVQGDQLNMTMFFWYHVKNDFSIVNLYSSGHWTSHFLKCHPVYH